MYTRRAGGGEYQVICPNLVQALTSRNLWTADIRKRIISNHGTLKVLLSYLFALSHAGVGSVQDIQEIPPFLREVYRTAWEMPQRALLDLAIARGPYIDQSQSTTIYMRAPTMDQIVSGYIIP